MVHTLETKKKTRWQARNGSAPANASARYKVAQKLNSLPEATFHSADYGGESHFAD
jgi:hypothetical protein